MFQRYCNYRGADNSLARPGRKQATATKLQLLQATQKQLIKLSFQPGLRGSNDLRVGLKIATFHSFFQSGRAKDLSTPCIKLHAKYTYFHVFCSERFKREGVLSGGSLSTNPNNAVRLSPSSVPPSSTQPKLLLLTRFMNLAKVLFKDNTALPQFNTRTSEYNDHVVLWTLNTANSVVRLMTEQTASDYVNAIRR